MYILNLTAIISQEPLAIFEFGVLEDPLARNKSDYSNVLQSVESGTDIHGSRL